MTTILKPSQQHAPLAVETAAGTDVFQLTQVHWSEALGSPFEGELHLLSADPNIDLEKLLKTPLGVRVDRPDGQVVWLHGYIHRLENLGPHQRLTRYRANVVSCLALLKYSGGSRIFQEFTTIEIVKKIFSNYGFSGNLETRLTGTYTQRPYCVQYAESDFNFVCRILEEEGIYFFCEYSQEKHCVILADDIQSHRPASGYATVEYRADRNSKLDEYLTNYTSTRQFGTGGVELSDYDFEKPKTRLTGKSLSGAGDAKWMWYDYPGNFTESDRAGQLAKIRQQAHDAAGNRIGLSGSVRGLRCGHTFKLQSHPTQSFNGEYLICSHQLSASLGGQQAGDSTEFSFQMQLTGQPSKLPFRPPATAHRTTMRGPHIATVCGKAGEEIWTDNYGRIKVQFPWDRDGKADDHSSCWIRVAQAWTGKTWGAMSLPRMGEEVIVEFLDGNPDRPIVVGRVVNADHMPPEDLAAAQAKTIFRTHSTKGGDRTNFHELTFDDTKDKEAIYLHSERDFKRVVENNDVTLVGFEKKDPGNYSLEVYHDAETKIGYGSEKGSWRIQVSKDRQVTVAQGNDQLTISQGDWVVNVSAGKTTVESAKSIELKCGGSSIVIKPNEIELSSTTIKLSASGELKMNGGNATLAASGNLQLKGALGTLQSSGPLTVKGAVVQIN
jgi:type VI secretion system secreted protein VgrG